MNYVGWREDVGTDFHNSICRRHQRDRPSQRTDGLTNRRGSAASVSCVPCSTLALDACSRLLLSHIPRVQFQTCASFERCCKNIFNDGNLHTMYSSIAKQNFQMMKRETGLFLAMIPSPLLLSVLPSRNEVPCSTTTSTRLTWSVGVGTTSRSRKRPRRRARAKPKENTGAPARFVTATLRFT